jgi:hypothetical protein
MPEQDIINYLNYVEGANKTQPTVIPEPSSSREPASEEDPFKNPALLEGIKFKAVNQAEEDPFKNPALLEGITFAKGAKLKPIPSFTDRIMTALDYGANISRTTLTDSLYKLKGIPVNMGDDLREAFKGKTTRTAADLRDALGIPRLATGANKDVLIERIGDMALNFGVDVISDPLTYATFGVGAIAKFTKFGDLSKLRKANMAIKGLGDVGEGLLNIESKVTKPALEKLGIKSSEEIYDTIKTAQTVGETDKNINALKKTLKLSDAEAIALKNINVDAIKDAMSYGKFMSGTRAAFGGYFGYAASNPDDPISKKLLNTAAGIGAVYGIGKTFPSIMKITKGATNSMVDYWQKAARGLEKGKPFGLTEAGARRLAYKEAFEIFPKSEMADDLDKLIRKEQVSSYVERRIKQMTTPMGAAEATEIAGDALNKLGYLKNMMMQGRFNITSELQGADVIRLTDIMHQMKNKTVTMRNQILSGKLPENIYNKYMQTGKIPMAYNKVVNEATMDANRLSKDFLPEMFAKEESHIIKSVNEWVAHNENVVKEYNKMTDNNMVGLAFHVDDVFTPNNFKEYENVIRTLTTSKQRFHMARGAAYLEDGGLVTPRRYPAQYKYSDPERCALINGIDNELTNKILQVEKAKNIDELSDLVKTIPEQYIPKGEKLTLDNIKLVLTEQADDSANKIIKQIKLTPESLDKSYLEYVDGAAKNFLTVKERQAMQIVNHIRNTKPTNKFQESAENFLHGYDKMHNLFKINVLGASLSWLSTNFWDNMHKAFVSGGFRNMRQTTMGSIPVWNRTLVKDIERIRLNRLEKFNDPEMLEGLKYGIIESTQYNTYKQGIDNTIKGLQTKSTLAKDFVEDPKTFLQKSKDILGGLYRQTGGRLVSAEQKLLEAGPMKWGNAMEVSARMTTYKNVRDGFMKDGTYEYLKNTLFTGQKGADLMAANQVKRMASQIVKDTFFDYRHVTAFEQSVMKRIMPFYTFFSRNVPYWLKSATDYTKIRKVQLLPKARAQIGRQLTEEEYAGMPPYIKEQAPRYLDDTEYGKVVGTFPKSSFIDAINMIDPTGDMLETSILSKMSPFLKTPIELAYGYDMFTKNALLPSNLRLMDSMFADETGKGKKYMFGGGFKWLAIQNALQKLGKDPEYFGVKIDKQGNPIATKDNVVILEKLWTTFFPLPIIDQVMGALGKHKAGKVESAEYNLLGYLNWYREATVSHKSYRRNKELEKIMESQQRKRVRPEPKGPKSPLDNPELLKGIEFAPVK